jgi:hypothetical protein
MVADVALIKPLRGEEGVLVAKWIRASGFLFPREEPTKLVLTCPEREE